MKKKISLLLLTILVFVININGVSAANSFSGGTLQACGFDYMPAKLPDFTSGLYNVIKLLVPILLIIMGMIDFTKAVMASDEKKMKESQKKFINRLIAGVVVFLIMAVVQFVFKQIDTTTEYKNGFANCINCILNGDKTACGGGTTDLRKHCTDYDYKVCNSKTDDYGNECMVDNSEPTNLKCKVKGNSCEDYTADECPVNTASGVHYCEVSNGKCRVACSGKSMIECEKLSYCRFERNDSWSGADGVCVAR